MSKALDKILEIGDHSTQESGEMLKGKRLTELAKNGVDLDFGEIGNLDVEGEVERVLEESEVGGNKKNNGNSGFRKKKKGKKKKKGNSGGLLNGLGED